MHSSFLRGDQFEITAGGVVTPHGVWARWLTTDDRLAVVAPDGRSGVAAANLILASVTAFYDHHRSRAGDFFTYPDYYTIQCRAPGASFTMLDIWPEHKDVTTDDTPLARLTAITDRRASVLVVPDEGASSKPTPLVFETKRERALAGSARRCVSTAFAYGVAPEAADLTISITHPQAIQSVRQWLTTVDPSMGIPTSDDASVDDAAAIVQHYRVLSVDEAFARV